MLEIIRSKAFTSVNRASTSNSELKIRLQKRAASAALLYERNSVLFRNRRCCRAVDAKGQAVDQTVDEGMRGCDRVVFTSTRHGVRV